MEKRIRCTGCRYAVIDHKASDYTKKHCGNCEDHKNCKFEKTDNICHKQSLNWAAYECGNPNSEYYKSLLNVTPNGDKQYRISWSGCEVGRVKG